MKMTKRTWLFGGAAVGMLILDVLVVLYAKHDKAEASIKAEAKAEPRDDRNLAISAAALAKNPIGTSKVVREKLAADLLVVGSVTFDEDHYALVGPLVSGRIAKLRVGVGDQVKQGQTLGEIESSEVGQAQAAFLSARARAGSANANLARERDLAAQRISSERDREVAEAQAVSETAELRAATERLRALGLDNSEIQALNRGDSIGGRVALRAPISGTVVARSVTLGQSVERSTDAFKIINLTHLWVLLDLYEKDLTRVHEGQKAELLTEAHPGEVFRARVAYIHKIVDEKTRTAGVRIELDNPDGKLRPGQFVTARLLGDPRHTIDALAIPRRAVQTIEGKTIVFVRTPRGFERRAVELGTSGGDLVEVKSGVVAQEEVATDGAFLLKSELLR